MTEFVHMELNTSDPEAAKEFYGQVFGWTYQEMPMPNGETYTMAAGANGGFGGIQASPMAGVPSHWLGYVGVGSLEATIAKVEGAGGRLVVQQAVPGNGTFAVFTDPQGAAFAAWEAATPAPAPASSAKKAAKKAASRAKKAAKKAASRATKAAKKAAKKAEKAATKAAKKAKRVAQGGAAKAKKVLAKAAKGKKAKKGAKAKKG